MTPTSSIRPGEVEKLAYLRDMEARLSVKGSRLRYIKRRIKAATKAQRIQPSDQLLRAEHYADSNVEALKKKLELLEHADDESWAARQSEVEAAWDELSQAIKKVVARFP